MKTTRRIPFAAASCLLLLLALPTAGQAELFYNTNYGVVTITGCDDCNGEVIIPSVIEGLPVTTIGYEAFEYGDLTSVVIPDSVTDIRGYAFYDCDALTNVTMGNGVTFIRDTSFADCNNLFNVTIGNSVTNIEDGAFGGCYSLTNITIPASVAVFGTRVFYECTNLIDIAVDVLNANFSSVDGVMFNKSQTALIQYPLGKIGDYTIPNGVTNIGDYAFDYATRLSNVSIPDSVLAIGEGAFNMCWGLTNVVIPESVTSLGIGEFNGCNNLISVSFEGNAPATGLGVFQNSSPTIYYYAGTTGWSNPWQGRPTVAVCVSDPCVTVSADLSVNSGATTNLLATASGTPPFGYQWRKEGIPLTNTANISGVDTDTLTFNRVKFAHQGGYDVIVSNTFGYATSIVANLTVVSSDGVNPSVSITSPANNSVQSTNQITVTGTAFDLVGVEEVWLSLNGGAYSQIAAPLQTFYNWSNLVTLVAGTNIVSVRAVDYSGNTSAVVSRSFFLSNTSPLTVLTDGNGSFMPASLNGSNLYIGRSYTLTAQAGPNWLFTNWTASVDGGPTNVVSSSAVYTFLMQPDLTLTANFITNSFISAAGLYYGLFSDETTPVVAHERSGLFTLKTDSKQKFSGKLYVDGNAVSFSGLLDLGGHGVSKPIVRKGKSAMQVTVEVSLDGSDTCSGTVICFSNTPYAPESPNGFTSAMTGYRAMFNLTDNPATNYLGSYTLVVNLPTNAASPQGYGYGIVTIKRGDGRVTSSGNLGDYVAFKPTAVPISKHGEWPLYAPAYLGYFDYIDPKSGSPKQIREYKGMLMGWMKFTNNTGEPAGRELLDGSVHWIKTPDTNYQKYYYDYFYAEGFTNHDLNVFASAWFAPTNYKTTRAIDFTNGSFVFSDGNLPGGSFSNHFTYETNNVTHVDPPNPGKVSMRVTYKTGLISGKFWHSNDVTSPVRVPKGAFLQDDNVGYGAFPGTNSSGSFLMQSD